MLITSEEDGSNDINNVQMLTRKCKTQHPLKILAAPVDEPFLGEQLTAFNIWLEYAKFKPFRLQVLQR